MKNIINEFQKVIDSQKLSILGTAVAMTIGRNIIRWEFQTGENDDISPKAESGRDRLAGMPAQIQNRGQ